MIIAPPAPDGPPVVLSAAQSRARWERIRQLNRQIVADQVADAGRVHAGLAAATATTPRTPRARLRPRLQPRGAVQAVTAGLAAATSAAGPPDAGEAQRVRNRVKHRRYARGHRAEVNAANREWSQANPPTARRSRYYQDHREEENARLRAWRARRRAAAAEIAPSARTAAGTSAAQPPVPAVSAVTQ